MTEEELKVKFDYIQGMFNRCISHACQILIDSITVKSRYLNREQADELERQEYIHAVDELSQLYIRYSVTLRTLEEDGFVRRQVYAEVPPRVEYSLTDRAVSLLPHINSLITWAKDNMNAILVDRENNRLKS